MQISVLAPTRELLLANIEVIEALAAMEKTEDIPEVSRLVKAIYLLNHEFNTL